MAENVPHQNYNYCLMLAMRSHFSKMIEPLSILHVFHKYNQKIISKRDYDAIRACTYQSGDTDGALRLLECLYKYNGWFECLQCVLRDPDVHLSHVADMMLVTRDKIVAQFPEQQGDKDGNGTKSN